MTPEQPLNFVEMPMSGLSPTDDECLGHSIGLLENKLYSNETPMNIILTKEDDNEVMGSSSHLKNKLTDEKERYSRHLMLENFGLEAQLKLKKAKVLVVGVGGLGCPALQYLTAAGVGCIGMMDDDIVCLSNLQRQVLFKSHEIGKYKVLVAKNTLQQLNPLLNFETYTERLSLANALEIIINYDIVLDGSDNFSTRYLLNDACVLLGKPLVYGAIYQFEGQVSVFNYQNGPNYRCLFPEPPISGEMLPCGEVGVIGVLPGIIGTWQATEVIKIITGVGTPLSGKLLTINLLNNNIQTFDFPKTSKPIVHLLTDYELSCGVSSAIESISMSTFRQLQREKKIQLIDVRQTSEHVLGNIGGKNIPLDKLAESFDMIDKTLVTVVYCQSGARSKQAVSLLKNYFPSMQIFNLNHSI